jgi:glycosyltransferase involved in cell wall biosynthesis
MQKPDIVHTHTPKAGLLGMLAAKISGVPIRMHTVAGLPWMETTGLVRILLKNMEKLTAFCSTMIYPNSKILRDFLYQQNIARTKMKVLGNGSSNGIDCSLFSLNEILVNAGNQLRENENILPSSRVWIFVGRLVKDKGIGELIDAFVQLAEQYPGDRLWLLGEEEPALDPLEMKHINLLRTHPSIKCWGFTKDIKPYLAASQILVFPSYREGFPNVPLQAGAMKCALILSDINGCNEIVEDGINGLLVPPKDKLALLNAMLKLRKDPDLQNLYAERIRTKIENQFDQKVLWSLIRGEYEALSKK